MRFQGSPNSPHHLLTATLEKQSFGVHDEGRFATCATQASRFSSILKVSPTKDCGLSFAGVVLEYLMWNEVVIDELEAGIGIGRELEIFSKSSTRLLPEAYSLITVERHRIRHF